MADLFPMMIQDLPHRGACLQYEFGPETLHD